MLVSKKLYPLLILVLLLVFTFNKIPNIYANPGNLNSGIFLNNFPNYISGAGQNLDLSQNQVVSFESLNVIHTFTLNKVGQTSINFTLRSRPLIETLKVGQSGKYDVSQGKVDNISIELLAIKNYIAEIRFSAINHPVTKIILKTKLSQIAKPNYLYPIIIIIALSIFLYWFLRRSYLKNRKK